MNEKICNFDKMYLLTDGPDACWNSWKNTFVRPINFQFYTRYLISYQITCAFLDLPFLHQFFAFLTPILFTLFFTPILFTLFFTPILFTLFFTPIFFPKNLFLNFKIWCTKSKLFGLKKQNFWCKKKQKFWCKKSKNFGVKK